MAKRFLVLALLYAAAAAANAPAKMDTFVVQSDAGGRLAIVTVPLGAISTFSANTAEVLADDSRGEAMRLSGDVRIRILGERAPIEISADRVVLELVTHGNDANDDPGPSGRGTHARPKRITGKPADTSFLTVATVAGAMKIFADRIEHRITTAD